MLATSEAANPEVCNLLITWNCWYRLFRWHEAALPQTTGNSVFHWWIYQAVIY